MSQTLPLNTDSGSGFTPSEAAADDTPPMVADPSTETPLPELKIARKKLPSGIASNVKQHVVFVRDHSSSMSGDKVAELNLATESLLLELANPENKDGFRVSVVDFNDRAQRMAFGEPAQTLSIAPATASGGTNFTAALQAALAAVQGFKQRPNDAGWHYLRPVVLFLSDGQDGVGEEVIDALQEEAEVIAIAYGADADLDVLTAIASGGQVETVGTDGGALRGFLASVGKTLSQGLQTNR